MEEWVTKNSQDVPGKMKSWNHCQTQLEFLKSIIIKTVWVWYRDAQSSGSEERSERKVSVEIDMRQIHRYEICIDIYRYRYLISHRYEN